MSAASGWAGCSASWRETREGLSYRIQVRDVTEGGPWRLDPFPVQGSRFEAQLLTGGHRYEFRVLADGQPSEIAAVTVQ